MLYNGPNSFKCILTYHDQWIRILNKDGVQYIVKWILSRQIYLDPIKPGSLMYTLARVCQFEVKSINQKLVNIFSKNFARMFTSLLIHNWIKKIQIILKVLPEQNINWGAYTIFCHFGVLIHCMGRYMREKITSNCKLTMLRLWYWQKEYTNAHLLGSTKELIH